MTRRFFRIAGILLGAALAVTLSAQEPQTFDSIVKRADAARDSGNVNEAVDLYQQALHLQPDWRQGWWVLGSVLYDANRYQECAEAFLPLTALDPDKSAGWAMSGLCEFETKHYKDSLAHLEKALQLGLPKGLYDVSQYHAELILIRTGEFDAALGMISRHVGAGDDNPKLAEAMGLAALRRPILPQDISAADHDLVMALGKAMCDGAAGRSRDATAEFENILPRYPNVPQLHYLYGMVLLQSNPDKAMAAFQQELALSPKHPQTLVSIAAEYVKRNDYQTALPYAERAVAADPSYFAAHAMLGKILVEGDLDLARGVKELETAVQMAPDNPQSHVVLASAYSKAGRKDDAAKQRAEFLRLRTQIDAAAAAGQK